MARLTGDTGHTPSEWLAESLRIDANMLLDKILQHSAMKPNRMNKLYDDKPVTYRRGASTQFDGEHI